MKKPDTNTQSPEDKVRDLIEQGADVYTRNLYEHTALMLASPEESANAVKTFENDIKNQEATFKNRLFDQRNNAASSSQGNSR